MLERKSSEPGVPGTKDGTGASDHDKPYDFDRRPKATDPSPFSSWQFARLLLLRGRLLDDAYADDRMPGCSLSIHDEMVWLGRAEDLLERPMDTN